MTDSERKQQEKRFKEMRDFDSANFSIDNGTSRGGLITVLKLPFGYIVHDYFGGTSHATAFTRKDNV